MLLNLIITGIVGFIILILWILKGVFDCISTISTMDQSIKKLAKVTDLLHDRLLHDRLLHDRLLHVEKLIVDQEEVKKNTTKNE